MEKLPLLGLVMIVKDEAHGIAATLESFLPYVDRVTILDTGSADETRGIIHKTVQVADVPYAVHEGPFVDFSSARNRALDLHGERTLFTIMPDSDDRLVGGAALRGFLESAWAECAYLVNIRRGDLSYHLPLLLRTSARWRYKGPVHEHIDGLTNIKIPGVQVTQDAPPLSVEASRKRWERDVVLLTDELVKHPGDPRTLFYLAQTWGCLGRYDTAIKLYRERIKVGGWVEETFEAYMRVAQCMQALEDPWPEIQQAYLEAHHFDPTRAEPLYKIAEHWHAKDAHGVTFTFASRAAELPRPDTTLFVDEDVYAYKAADLATITGFYLKDKNAMQVGARCAEQVVRARPADERVRANQAFYAPGATEIFKSYNAKLIDFKSPDGYSATNPSIHYDHTNGLWRCIVRTTNYRIVDGKYVTPDDGVIRTRNFMLNLDRDLRSILSVEMLDATGGARSSYPVHGFEDCRLFRHLDRLHFTATVCDFDLERALEGPREIVLGELNQSYQIIKATPLRGTWSAEHQKNWMPFDERPRHNAGLIYGLPDNREESATRLELSRALTLIEPAGQRFKRGRLRGGSQLIRVPDGWLCVVHDVAFTVDNARIYLHRFVLLGETFRIQSMTDPFFFEKKGIEFCAGLACADQRRLVVSFGVDDKEAHLAQILYEDVRAKLRTDFWV